MTDNHDIISQAVIKWLHGLDQTPTIWPMGRTAEETEKIRKFLEKALMMRHSNSE